MGLDRSLGALLAGAVTIAGLHALIPSHWLAFVLIARRQRWTIHRTLLVTTLAGAGHIALTVALGLLLARAGKAALNSLPPALEHAATAALLILLGSYFLWTSRRDGGHSHHHGLDEQTEETEAAPTGRAGRIADNPTIIGALALGMTLSPCLDLLSVYVAAAAQPLRVLLLMSGVMAAVTLGLMNALVWLTWRGMQRLNLHWLEHNEGRAVGGLLILLGIALFFL